MDDEERCKQAFESVRDTAKQLITLATGIIALTVTFSNDFLKATTTGRWMVHGAWYLLLLSAAAGVWVLMAVTGALGSKRQLSHTDTFKSNITLPAILQILTFGLGLLLAVIFGARR